MTTHLNRRHFIRNSAAAGLGLAAAGRARAASPNDKLNIACIGLGGQMKTDLQQVAALGHNIVAVCDVDKGRLDFTRKERGAEIQAAKFYTDYRKLLDKEKSVDAVIIATPDHWHAMICSAAIQAGKHVYCEKPLAHTVGEARALAELAKRSKVVTQTGNQGSASGNLRRSIELIRAGMLGDVREVHIWEPAHGWPSGVDRAAGTDPVPDGLDWNLWLGPAPVRPYKASVYHPSNWRGWFDFGGGSIADFCCHNFNLPVRALGLDYPSKIAFSGTNLGNESFPSSCKVRFSFPAGAGRGPVTIFFTSGGERPPAVATAGMAETFGSVPEGGCLLVGDKGTISAGRWNTDCYVRLKDEPKFRGADNHDAAKQVPVSLPRAPGNSHMREWTEACTGGAKTFSPFEIGGHITEIGAAGLVALRIGHDIDWDGPAMKVPGLSAADAFIKPQARVF
jgi:predicted dehydrogenase